MNDLDDFLCERECEEYPDEFWEYLFAEHLEEEWQKDMLIRKNDRNSNSQK